MSAPRLGAVAVDGGVRFALLSRHATAVELCLFAPDGATERERIALARDGDVWSREVPGIGPGQLYGYRVHGPYRPQEGHRFNPHKLLVDPYARRLHGVMRWDPATCGYLRGHPDADLSFDPRDSAPFVPKAVVVADAAAPTWSDRPWRPWSETVIYEAHVKGLTMLHPDLPPEIRGTCEALAHPAVVGHLVALGVTALELLPIQAFADDGFLVERGLSNYWGYSTLNFFCPESRYLGPAGEEGLRAAVRALHAAGIEVILDVVYNHTAELDHLGPTLSFRGLDNALYYKLRPGEPRFNLDCTGTGNTFDASRPEVADLILASLRHWAEQYGIDGFRFDLATSLARDPVAFDPEAAILERIGADPLLGSLKLIAEPWDIGESGYRIGAFPTGWGEWNDRYRDTVRRFWRGDPGQVPRLADGLSGSRALFGRPGRTPAASINCVTTHDGFTLRDLVSYEHRHNEANQEGNRDGHHDNLSANHGAEGPTTDQDILAVRARQSRNLLATLLLSQGVPMLLAGDELARSQGGNNNPYCQDNAVTWLDWDAGRALDPELRTFVAHLLATRRACAALRRTTFLTGEPVTGEPVAGEPVNEEPSPSAGRKGLRDVHWYAPDGREMEVADWENGGLQTLGMQTGNEPGCRPLLLLFHAGSEPVAFRLPELPAGPWRAVLDTSRRDGRGPEARWPGGGTIPLPSRSVVLLKQD